MTGLNTKRTRAGPGYVNVWRLRRDDQLAAFLAALRLAILGALAGRLLPNDPLKRFPLAVFLSPLPMVIDMND